MQPGIRISFLLQAGHYPTAGTDHTLSTHSSPDGHVGGFCLVAVVHESAVNVAAGTSLPVLAFTSPGHGLKNRIAGSRAVLSLWGHGRAVFHTTCPMSHSHQQGTNVPIFPHPHQHLLVGIFFSFDRSHPDGCEVGSHGGFFKY